MCCAAQLNTSPAAAWASHKQQHKIHVLAQELGSLRQLLQDSCYAGMPHVQTINTSALVVIIRHCASIKISNNCLHCCLSVACAASCAAACLLNKVLVRALGLSRPGVTAMRMHLQRNSIKQRAANGVRICCACTERHAVHTGKFVMAVLTVRRTPVAALRMCCCWGNLCACRRRRMVVLHCGCAELALVGAEL